MITKVSKKEIERISKKIKQIAKKNKDGFTVTNQGGFEVPRAWCVAVKETQNSFSWSSIRKVVRYAVDNGLYVGGWYDSVSGRYYFDAVKIVEDKEEAIQEGIANNQLAIFNLATFEEYRLDLVA